MIISDGSEIGMFSFQFGKYRKYSRNLEPLGTHGKIPVCLTPLLYGEYVYAVLAEDETVADGDFFDLESSGEICKINLRTLEIDDRNRLNVNVSGLAGVFFEGIIVAHGKNEIHLIDAVSLELLASHKTGCKSYNYRLLSDGIIAIMPEPQIQRHLLIVELI